MIINDEDVEDKITYCQEGGGEGQGAGSKNLKKKKLFYDQRLSEIILAM